MRPPRAPWVDVLVPLGPPTPRRPAPTTRRPAVAVGRRPPPFVARPRPRPDRRQRPSSSRRRGGRRVGLGGGAASRWRTVLPLEAASNFVLGPYATTGVGANLAVTRASWAKRAATVARRRSRACTRRRRRRSVLPTALHATRRRRARSSSRSSRGWWRRSVWIARRTRLSPAGLGSQSSAQSPPRSPRIHDRLFPTPGPSGRARTPRSAADDQPSLPRFRGRRAAPVLPSLARRPRAPRAGDGAAARNRLRRRRRPRRRGRSSASIARARRGPPAAAGRARVGRAVAAEPLEPADDARVQRRVHARLEARGAPRGRSKSARAGSQPAPTAVAADAGSALTWISSRTRLHLDAWVDLRLRRRSEQRCAQAAHARRRIRRQRARHRLGQPPRRGRVRASARPRGARDPHRTWPPWRGRRRRAASAGAAVQRGALRSHRPRRAHARGAARASATRRRLHVVPALAARRRRRRGVDRRPVETTASRARSASASAIRSQNVNSAVIASRGAASFDGAARRRRRRPARARGERGGPARTHARARVDATPAAEHDALCVLAHHRRVRVELGVDRAP